MTDLLAWVGLGMTVVVGSLMTLGATIGIARSSRIAAFALLVASGAGLWWFVTTGVHFPTDPTDWTASSRFAAAAFLGTAIVGYVVGVLQGRHEVGGTTGASHVASTTLPPTLATSLAGQGIVRVDGDRYVNLEHGFSLQYIQEWIVQDFDPQFRARGGFLAIDSPDHSATLNISAGPVDTSFFASDTADLQPFERWIARARFTFEDLRTQVRGTPIRQLDYPSLDGERRVARFEFSTPAARMGKLCALHTAREFVAYYSVNGNSAIDMDAILRSWTWQPNVTR